MSDRDLDALAIGQALAALDPRWGEHAGTPRGLVWCHADHQRLCIVTAGRALICATVTDPAAPSSTLAALHGAIWGPAGTSYALYPPGSDGAIHLVGRADGQPALGRLG